MSRVIINAERCKGCSLCVQVCPKKCLAQAADVFNTKGYHPAAQISDECTGCAMCAMMCPDVAIKVEKD